MKQQQFDVFISYSRKELDKIREIKSAIEETVKVKCWMDLNAIESGSSRFTKDIIDGINQCKVFLFMLSVNSQASKYALKELDFAEKKEKHVVIINVDDCQMNDEFLFLYGMCDTICWNDKSQRNKLMRDLRKWTGRGDEIKEIVQEEGIRLSSYELYLKGVAAYRDKDYAEALRWYRKSAEQGNASAQFYLGWMYHKGQGVEKDLAAALVWYTKSAKQGNENAKKELKELNIELD